MTELALNLILESDPKNVAEVEPFVRQVFREYNLDESNFGNILIALTEAVSNAIIHGNHALANKKVIVSTVAYPKKISFTVEDEGQGFNPHNLPDPTAPENLLTLGGRGVFLMQQLADKITFFECGRIVQMDFNLN
jgi:serine/threonine-protein kinase RsbW